MQARRNACAPWASRGTTAARQKEDVPMSAGLAQPSLRRFHHSAFPPERLVVSRSATISVCLPARNEAATIGAIVQALLPLVDAGAIDQLVVLDDSTDG